MNHEVDRRIRPAVHCRSYAPGHTVHVIQWNRALKDPDAREAATVLDLNATHLIVRFDVETSRLSNHDIDRARDLLTVHGPQVQVQPRWGVLWFGTYVISIRDVGAGPLGSCPTEPSPSGWVYRSEPYVRTGGR